MIQPITSEDENYFFSASPSLRSILEQVHCLKAVEFLTPCSRVSKAKETPMFIQYLLPLLKKNYLCRPISRIICNVIKGGFILILMALSQRIKTLAPQRRIEPRSLAIWAIIVTARPPRHRYSTVNF